MADITYTSMGGRVVELFIPFTPKGEERRVDKVRFDAPCLDHSLRWGAGEIAGTLALMAELSGESEAVLRQLRFPDADRVMNVFMEMLPPEIGSAISQRAGARQNEEEDWRPPPMPPPQPEQPSYPGPNGQTSDFGVDLGN